VLRRRKRKELGFLRFWARDGEVGQRVEYRPGWLLRQREEEKRPSRPGIGEEETGLRARAASEFFFHFSFLILFQSNSNEF
jgi:hypothetical protein